MGERSKAETLPAETREALDKRLLQGGFAGYVQLQDWLRAQGFDISKSSLHRYGSRLEEKLAKLKSSADRARALVEASPDAADDMAQATMRLLQEKIFTVLETMEDVDPDSVDLVKLGRVMAPIVRASIATKKHAAETAERMAAADKKVADEAGAGRIKGVTPEALAQIRAIYTGAVVGPGVMVPTWSNTVCTAYVLFAAALGGIDAAIAACLGAASGNAIILLMCRPRR